MIYSLAWAELKQLIQKKGISIQFVELSEKYILIATDGPLVMDAAIKKTDPRNSDQIDFEDNFKELETTDNRIVQQVSLTLSEDNLETVKKSFDFTATENSTSIHDFLLNDKYLFKGVSFISPNAAFGDFIKVEIIDKDNVLESGENTIVKTPVEKAFVQATDNINPINIEILSVIELPAAGLYFRVHYTNSVSLDPVKIFLNLDLYKRV